jgi:uncharacterized membrane protein
MSTAKNFFTEEEQTKLVAAIAQAELHTSGEIRLHLESFCVGDEVTAAKSLFTKLGMHKTQERNGVLFYIATVSHKIAVVGDEGIYQKLGAEFWYKLVQQLIDQFKVGKKSDALAAAILECGKQLGAFFPRQKNDKDELSNEISF